ncbi:hypothetical protein [Streptomyces olivaceus]|uniref:hypothetical protein n=1 Tax=Streptomyces olivaceus TaxID=47716 RepID=UPI0036853A1A
MRSKRQLMDGIRRRTRAGAPWRDVPSRTDPEADVAGQHGRAARAPGQTRSEPKGVRLPREPRLPCWSRPSTSGCDQHLRNAPLGAVTGPRIFRTRRAGEGQGTRPVAGIGCPAAGRVRWWDA